MSRSRKARSVTDEAASRRSVVDIAQEMSRTGLSPGRSGNVSCRFGDGMLITPTGLEYHDMTTEDVVFVGRDGAAGGGKRKPSSEWHFHLAAYAARPDRHALVHAHSLHATVLACAHKPIPAFHYMVAVAGGRDIPCVPYATFGTEALADHLAAGLKERDACLMANHGQVAIGETLPQALELAREVEVLAEQYLKVLMLNAVHLIDEDEMDRVIAKFKTYGARAQV
jgi:L-fuculose-phosphate aldolase